MVGGHRGREEGGRRRRRRGVKVDRGGRRGEEGQRETGYQARKVKVLFVFWTYNIQQFNPENVSLNSNFLLLSK